MMFLVSIYDKNSLKKLKKYNIAKVLHHMKGTPELHAKKS